MFGQDKGPQKTKFVRSQLHQFNSYSVNSWFTPVIRLCMHSNSSAEHQGDEAHVQYNMCTSDMDKVHESAALLGDKIFTGMALTYSKQGGCDILLDKDICTHSWKSEPLL